MKKQWLNVLRILVSVGALGFLFYQIGLGETLIVLREADLPPLFLAFLIFLLSLVIRAGRWAALLWALDLSIPFKRLVYLYFVGAFYNSFLPSGFGGDVARTLELTSEAPTSAAVGTVLVDRMTGLLVLLAMGLAALPFSASHLPPQLTWLLIVVSVGGLTVGALLLEGRLLRRATAWLPDSLSLSGSGVLGRIYAAVSGCGWQAVGRALGISLAFNVLNICINFLCGRAVGIDLGFGYFLITAPLISVSLMLPISVGGVGVRDWVTVALFEPVGVSRNTAAAMSICIYAVSAASGLVGGLMYGIKGLHGMRQETT